MSVFLTPNNAIACKGEPAKHVCLYSYKKEDPCTGVYLMVFSPSSVGPLDGLFGTGLFL